MSTEIVWTRTVAVRYEADVAVIGGGIAGVSAALAAAKSGARVVLVERFGITGGVLTSGGVGNWSGCMGGEGEVFDTIHAAQKAWRSVEEPQANAGHGCTNTVFDHEILAFILQELLLERGVKMLLHTRFVDVRVSDNGRISEAIVCGASGPEALSAKVWIDATGEASVARAAGFAVMHGREDDHLTIPMSEMAFVREQPDHAEPQVPEDWLARWPNPIAAKDDLPMVSIWPNGPGEKAIKIKIPRYDAGDTESLTAGEIAARRRMFQVLNYYQRVEPKGWRYDHASPIVGIREGRRIVGDHVLCEEEVRAGCTFDDVVARASFYFDGVTPDNDKREYVLPHDRMKVPPYQIPLRCLIAKDGTNLFMAGRCFSADQTTLSSARVAPTGSMMGSAVGIAGALAAARSCGARDIDVREVQAELRTRNACFDV